MRFAEEGAQLVLNDLHDSPSLRTGADVVIGDIAREKAGRELAQGAEIADWRKVLDVDVIGTALVSKFAIPCMREHGGSIG